MAVWISTDGESWDDGETTSPGDEGFSRSKAKEHFADRDFNYVGTPNRPESKPEQEQDE